MTQTLKPASSIILRNEQGAFLLVRRANPPAADMYAFPGGRAEDGETPEQTALRELTEETGLTASNARLFATYELPGKNDGGFYLSVFIADCAETGHLKAADDAAEAGWFSLEEARALLMPQSVLECMERIESGEI